MNCITCTIPIGFFENLPDSPFGCVSAAVSTTRTIPAYPTGTNTVDWRDWGIIRPIDDQGICGSGYAFSTIHSVESVNAIRTGQVHQLSVQAVVDCGVSDVDGCCQGCNGGDISWTTKYLASVGTYFAVVYPYTNGVSTTEGTCQADSLTKVDLELIKVSDVAFATNDNLESRLDFLKSLRDQPLNIAFEVTNSFR
jgi:C1A family cysteine protease